MLFVISKYAFRNLLRAPLRSLFTLISIILIIVLYTVLTSIGDSFTSQITKVLNQQDIDIAVQAKYAATPVSSVIDEKTYQKMITLDEIRTSDALLIGRKRLESRALVFILGVSNVDAFGKRLGFSIVKGRSLKGDADEIVIGQKMAALYHLKIGETLTLDQDKNYHIVGIYSSWLNFLNSGILIDLKSAQTLLFKPNKVSLLFLTLNDTTQTDRVLNIINSQFPEVRAIKSIQLPNYLGPIKSIFYFSKIVSILTLLIAVAVLLNTFIMTIGERTKEIGILSAIGWSRGMIIKVFLLEALMLSYTGGILGYLFAFPLMYFLQSYYSGIAMYLPMTPELDVLLNVMIICFVIAVLSIFFPALYGTKITIAKAIRHE